eukprot:gene32709-40369_t
MLFFLGVNPPGADPAQWAANHSPRFNPDEAALLTGVRALASLAADYLTAFTIANRVEGEALYRLRQYSPEGEAAWSQCGLALAAESLARLDVEQPGLLLLIADERTDERLSEASRRELGQQLRRLGQDGVWILGACGTGAQVLAQHGLLDGYRAAIDWQCQAEAAQRYPGTLFTPGLYEIDRNRISAGAGAGLQFRSQAQTAP